MPLYHSGFRHFVVWLAFILTMTVLSYCTHNQGSWAEAMAKSEMQRSHELWQTDHSKKLRWNCAHGIMGQAFLNLYASSGNPIYQNYVINYVDTMVFDDGLIYGYKADEYNLSRLNNGKLLICIYKAHPNSKYLSAIERLRSQIKTQPVSPDGSFWHQQISPNQMWLDDIYMYAPFCSAYCRMKNDTTGLGFIAHEFKLMYDHLIDPQCGLLRHACDLSHTEPWADPVNGQSLVVWSQGVGYYVVALTDVLDDFPENHPDRKLLTGLLQKLAKAIVSYQDPQTGLWFQVTDRQGEKGNYLESTGSCMFVYSLMKGVRCGYLDDHYRHAALKGYEGIIRQFVSINESGEVNIGAGCVGAGPGGKPYRDGSFSYYISEPGIANDSRTVGFFMMASIECEGYLNNH